MWFIIYFIGRDITREQDESVRKRIIKIGEGNLRPNEGATVELALKGTYNDQVLEDRTVKFFLGEGCEENVPAGYVKT